MSEESVIQSVVDQNVDVVEEVSPDRDDHVAALVEAATTGYDFAGEPVKVEPPPAVEPVTAEAEIETALDEDPDVLEAETPDGDDPAVQDESEVVEEAPAKPKAKTKG